MQEMVIHSQAKHLVREAVIGRFEPHLYQIDIPYVNVNEQQEIQLLDSRPGRKKTMLSGVQQNLAKVVLWLVAHKKEVPPYDLRTFNFITPDVPLHPNEHDCGVFVINSWNCRQWGGGGVLQINRCGEIETLQVEDHGEYVVLSTKCTLRPCPKRLKGIVDSERVDKSEVNGDRLKEAQHINRSLSVLGDVISALA
ncbi:Kinesin-like protein KIN-14I [Vitis vinifera]|uniref:Kinesin-like protein KIN-14I n=1 Tax=Vitis vinifera TaxID=29760 RepID=A0A438EMU7_VITVI|nr:Kinesin-like protein KIN-14I [Vitis vinifera]